MSGMFDRLREELDQLGDRVSQAMEQGKLQIEKTNVQGLRSDAARELGLLTWRKTRGEEIDEARYETLLTRLDDYKTRLDRIDREMASARAEDVSVGNDPPPASQPVDAEVTADAGTVGEAPHPGA